MKCLIINDFETKLKYTYAVVPGGTML